MMNIVVAYTPTLIKSESVPEVRDDARKVTMEYKKDKHALIIMGDFNAKTGSAYWNYPNQIGKYGNGKLNSNAEFLLELAKENNLFLTNTMFHHKLTHRTTWT